MLEKPSLIVLFDPYTPKKKGKGKIKVDYYHHVGLELMVDLYRTDVALRLRIICRSCAHFTSAHLCFATPPCRGLSFYLASVLLLLCGIGKNEKEKLLTMIFHNLPL